jgi:regulator of RNase E activity RraA
MNMTDDQLFEIARKELFPALLGDVLDKMGYLHQYVTPAVKPLSPTMVVIGRAMPVLEANVLGEIITDTHNPLLKIPFGLMFDALDDLRPNEVYICSGAAPEFALWGGLMSTRALQLGAAGAVLNGYSRDTNEILALDFSVFSTGTFGQDQGPRGKVLDFRTPINFSGVTVHPGDIVFGDRDGVIIIPEKAAAEAFARAIEKSRGEKLVKKALESGMSAKEAFNTFGIM